MFNWLKRLVWWAIKLWLPFLFQHREKRFIKDFVKVWIQESKIAFSCALVKEWIRSVPSRPRALTKVKVKDTVGPREGPEEGGWGVAKKKRRRQDEASPVEGSRQYKVYRPGVIDQKSKSKSIHRETSPNGDVAEEGRRLK